MTYKTFIFAFLIFFALFDNVNAGTVLSSSERVTGLATIIKDVTVSFQGGRLFANDHLKFKYRGAENDYHYSGDYGVTTDSINNTWVYGINSDIFFNEYIGLNINISQMNFRVPGNQTNFYGSGGDYVQTLTSPVAKQSNTLLMVGPVFRYTESTGLWSQLNPYIGIDYVYGRGNVSNANLGTFNGVDGFDGYGQGGSSGVETTGYSPRVGATYTFDNNVNVGLEYKYLNLTSKANNFRSFTNGYETDIRAHVALASIGYKFNM